MKSETEAAPDFTTARISGEDDRRIAAFADDLERETKGLYPKHRVISLALDALERERAANKLA